MWHGNTLRTYHGGHPASSAIANYAEARGGTEEIVYDSSRRRMVTEW